MNALEITSSGNESVKLAASLHQAKNRKREGLHLAEGEKLLQEALSSGMRVPVVFCEKDYLPAVPDDPHIQKTYVIPRHLMEKISECETPQKVCAIVETPDFGTPEGLIDDTVLILDRIQDPGNVGTMIRTADAFGISSVFLGTGTADPYSCKTLRSSMGSAYHVTLYSGEVPPFLLFLKNLGYQAVCGHLRGSQSLPEMDPRKTALVIGNEGGGVSDDVAGLCTLYRIPMTGRAESLNASVAAAILMYEIKKEH